MPRESGQAKPNAEDQHRLQDGSAGERLPRIIEETDWNELTTRLLVFATSRLARHRSRGGAKTPEDYVTRAVFLTREGRHFPAARREALFGFLCNVVDSLISHDADPTKTTRTIKPAVGSSRVSAEEARAAARLVYRDGKTGGFVILDGEPLARKPARAKRSVRRTYPRHVAKQAEGSAGPSPAPRVKAKKR